MKRLIVCCDGTWQSHNNQIPTNVLKIALATKRVGEDGISQMLYYDRGIGAVRNYKRKPGEEKGQSRLKGIVDRLQKIGGGAFGWWMDLKIEEAYIFLCLNYEPGDEIYLFGFSRGAYAVRSLAGLISYSGLLKPHYISKTSEAYDKYLKKDKAKKKTKDGSLDKDKAKEETKNGSLDEDKELIQPKESVRIKFLGCWDTVGAFGFPDILPFIKITTISHRIYSPRGRKLSPIIENARHAVAIDEKRSAFNVTMMEGKGFEGTLKQVWFPGDHGCVGGGTNETIKLLDNCDLDALKLSNVALYWMAEQAINLGLDLDFSQAESRDVEKNNSSQNFLIKMIGSVVKIISRKERDIHQLHNSITRNGKLRITTNIRALIGNVKLRITTNIRALKRNGKLRITTNIIKFLKFMINHGVSFVLMIKYGVSFWKRIKGKGENNVPHDSQRLDLDRDFHNSFKELWSENENYRPKNIPKYIRKQLDNYCQQRKDNN